MQRSHLFFASFKWTGSNKIFSYRLWKSSRMCPLVLFGLFLWLSMAGFYFSYWVLCSFYFKFMYYFKFLNLAKFRNIIQIRKNKSTKFFQIGENLKISWTFSNSWTQFKFSIKKNQWTFIHTLELFWDLKHWIKPAILFQFHDFFKLMLLFSETNISSYRKKYE